MRPFLGFYKMMSEMMGHGKTVSCIMLYTERPRWLQRIKEGHILPWMIQRRPVRLVSHAPVMMNRMICSLRLQTHLVK